MDFPRALSVALRRALFQLRPRRPVAPPVATAVSPGMSTGGGSAPSRGPLGACVQPERKRRAEEPVRPARPRSPRGGSARGPCTTRSPRGRGGQAQEQPARLGAARKRRGASKEGRWWCMGGACRASKHALPACRYCLGPQCPTCVCVAHRPTRLWHAWPGGPVAAAAAAAAGGPASAGSGSARA